MVGKRHHCDAPGCGKSFTRSDHLARHRENHAPKYLHQCSWDGCGKRFVRKDVKEKHELYHRKREQKEKQKQIQKVDKDNSIDSRSQPLSSNASVSSDMVTGQISPLSLESFRSPKELFPTDLAQWLFNDTGFMNQGNSQFDLGAGIDAEKMLEEAFSISPKFQSSLKAPEDNVILKLFSYIPQLRDLSFSVDHLQACLNSYWAYYHIQYPIIHKPSFSVNEVHPFLLLSMIMMGSYTTSPMDLPFSKQVADCICKPLRWLIVSSDDFGVSTKAWTLQSLIILESYEILFSNRKLHERAYLHHGLKIQLLRRSPLLGGDPYKRNYEDDDFTEEKDPWRRWIEVESLKRCALVSFYLDCVNSIVYGHEINLFAHQIKLPMPCDDLLWEMSVVDKENLPPQTDPPQFVPALIRLLHREKIEVSSLNKKLLLAGLLTIKQQMEQKDLQMTFLRWKSVEESWKDTIYDAIEVWRTSVCHEDCCDARNAFYFSQAPENDILSDMRCKFPIYHLSQAFTKLSQYDLIIYVGSSSRMSVKTTERDFRAVEERINRWATSMSGRLSALHCYQLLFELHDDKSDYDPATDPVLYRPNIVALSLFIIWAYNYVLSGPELREGQESGYSYLTRVQKALNSDGQSLRKNIRTYSSIFEKIPNKHHLIGLLNIYRTKFSNCQSEICREYAGLLANCILRSRGHERKFYT